MDKDNLKKQIREELGKMKKQHDCPNQEPCALCGIERKEVVDTITDKAYEAGVEFVMKNLKDLKVYEEIQKSTAEEICEMIMGKMSYTEKGLINREDLVEKIKERYEI